MPAGRAVPRTSRHRRARHLDHTWHTILAVGRLIGDLAMWAMPYILLGAVVVLPLLLLGYLIKRGSGWR